MNEQTSMRPGRLWGEAFGMSVIFFAALFISSIIGVIIYGIYLAGQGESLNPNDLETAAKVSFLFLPVATIISLLMTHIFLRKSGRTWADIGLWKPSKLGMAILLGVAITVVAFAASIGVNSLLLSMGIEPDLSAFDFLAGDFFMYIYLITVISWFSAGFAEEVVFRGFVMGNLARALGDDKKAWIIAAVLQAGIFGLMHSYQGVGGIITTGTIAFVFGMAYFYIRNLWPVIIAHGLVDVIAISVLYYGEDIPV